MVVMNRKNLRSLAAGVALLMAVGALAGCGGEKKADDSKKMVTVGIAQLVEHGALDAANKGFVAGMASKGFKENENVKYDRQNAQADQSNLQNIAQRFVSNKVDLICAIATPTAQTMANATKDIPIVATAVTDYEVAKLAASNSEPKGNVTGTSDMNPIDQQLELLLKIAPQTKNIGTVYSSSEVNSQLQVDVLKKLAGDKGINVIEATVSTVNDIQQAAQAFIGQKQDSLYNDDRLRVDPDCFVGTIVLAVVIDRTVNGSSRFQFLQMLDQKVGLQRIRMIVVYRHSLLERDTILTAIVIVVV